MKSLPTLYYNATILTLDPNRPRAEAMLIQDGVVVATGSVSELANTTATRVDLQGSFVVPGFNDCHMHILSMGLGLRQVDVTPSEAPSITDIVARVADGCSAMPAGSWVLGRGYNQNLLPERRHPNRTDLDAVSGGNPVVLWHTSGHVVVANSRALELAGIGAGSIAPEGGEIERDDKGEPTGVLKETAIGLVRSAIPPPTDAYARDALLAASDVLAGEGITSATDAATGQNMGLAAEINVYLAALNSPGFKTRMVVMPLIEAVTAQPHLVKTLDDGIASSMVSNSLGSRWLKRGPVKIFADGALTTRTAAMRSPYMDGSGHGILTWNTEELHRQCRSATDIGCDLAAHGIGDAAISQILDILTGLNLTPDARPRIEHATICDHDLINRMKELGVTVVLQPEDILVLGDAYPPALGDQRAADNSPVSWFAEAGVPIAFSSDRPVTPGHPLVGIQAAVERRTASGNILGPEHRVSVETAIRYYTSGAAYSTRDESWKGTLQPGMAADFVVLDRDLTTCEPSGISTAKVLQTVTAGATVFEA